MMEQRKIEQREVGRSGLDPLAVLCRELQQRKVKRSLATEESP
jgi:hypothetical protein